MKAYKTSFVYYILIATQTALRGSCFNYEDENTTPLSDAAFTTMFLYTYDLLTDLINSVVSSKDRVVHIVEVDTHSVKILGNRDTTILDVLAVSASGSLTSIEVGVVKEKYFEPRASFYWYGCYGRIFANENSTDKRVEKVVRINILNFTVDDSECSKRVHTARVVCEDKCPFMNRLELHLVEVPKFLEKFKAAKKTHFGNSLEAWMAYFGTGHTLNRDKIPAEFDEYPKVKRAVEGFHNLVYLGAFSPYAFKPSKWPPGDVKDYLLEKSEEIEQKGKEIEKLKKVIEDLKERQRIVFKTKL